jgi:anti-sigma factor RsiW
MTCTDFLSQLTDFFDGAVEPQLLAEVEKHIAECKHCEVVLDTTTKTINIYRDHEVYYFPTDLMAKCCGPRP